MLFLLLSCISSVPPLSVSPVSALSLYIRLSSVSSLSLPISYLLSLISYLLLSFSPIPVFPSPIPFTSSLYSSPSLLLSLHLLIFHKIHLLQESLFRTKVLWSFYIYILSFSSFLSFSLSHLSLSLSHLLSQHAQPQSLECGA
jgi:hypothetical protein